MQQTILSTIQTRKGISRESLSAVAYKEYPDATRFKFAYELNTALKKGYIKKNNPSASARDKHQTYSITTLGKARLKLLELQENQPA